MSKKPFNHVVLSIGYTKVVVPKDVAFKFFDMMVGEDVYVMDEEWDSNIKESVMYARLMSQDKMPTISSVNPVTFHAALLAAEQKDARKD